MGASEKKVNKEYGVVGYIPHTVKGLKRGYNRLLETSRIRSLKLVKIGQEAFIDF